jgi:hypothetical protein
MFELFKHMLGKELILPEIDNIEDTKIKIVLPLGLNERK